MDGNAAGAADSAAQALAAELRTLRKQSALTLRELEEATFTSDSALSRHLNGRSIPPWPVAEELCRLGGGDVSRLRELWQRAKAARVDNRGRRNGSDAAAADGVDTLAETADSASEGDGTSVDSTQPDDKSPPAVPVTAFEPDIRHPPGQEDQPMAPPATLGRWRKVATGLVAVAVLGVLGTVGSLVGSGGGSSAPNAERGRGPGVPGPGLSPTGAPSGPAAVSVAPSPGTPVQVDSAPTPPPAVRPNDNRGAGVPAPARAGDAGAPAAGPAPGPPAECPGAGSRCHQPAPGAVRRSGWWRLDVGGGREVPDSSGNGFGATAYGDVSWVSGRGARVARLDGAGEISVPRAVLRTDQSYTVAAWVRLTDGAKHATAVSQDGERASSFYLQFNGDSKRWGFACPIQDADLAVGIHAQSAEPAALHTWTHLTGVYDAAAAEVRLYVNGKLVASRAYHGAWQGNGPLRIGRAKWIGNAHDWWRGEISDVVAVTGVLPESEIRRLAE